MEEGAKTKKTIFVGGIGEDVDEEVILDAFSTFGDIIDVQLPTNATGRPHENRVSTTEKHRGYAFVTFSSAGDAQDAIDNMDMNELRGRILKVSIARPMKGVTPATGNRAIWESEDWLKQYAKPLAGSGGLRGPRNDSPEAPGQDDAEQTNDVAQDDQ
ncbi:RNA-binding domain-containing protein [Russula ochroleuca]|uniref:RNA-binding domain-containing protein n=1 Tax=Russula ochroleuca TaxID=152965 RepID=A0A9P5T829_9AGAM|nr:RNA-binding domain-containing protein [Russula ochroleuca]